MAMVRSGTSAWEATGGSGGCVWSNVHSDSELLGVDQAAVNPAVPAVVKPADQAAGDPKPAVQLAEQMTEGRLDSLNEAHLQDQPRLVAIEGRLDSSELKVEELLEEIEHRLDGESETSDWLAPRYCGSCLLIWFRVSARIKRGL